MITRRATKNDLQGILDLQEVNLFGNLSAEERKNGFIAIPFTEPQLRELLNELGLFVAESEGEIVGYTMAGSWGYFFRWPLFPYMISRLSGFVFNGIAISDQTSFQYGPICIASNVRGTDTFPRLFEAMRIELSSRYPVGITFVNKANQRSYNAHTRKLGLVVVDEFEFSGQAYYSLAFDTAQSVLPAQSANED